MATATKIIQRLRNLLSGHDLQAKLQLRYGEIAKRTLPPPKLPVGPSHKFAFNYYNGRDGRRESAPAMVVMTCQKALIACTTDITGLFQALEVPAKRPVTPGNVPRELTLSTDQPYL
ncbi:NADH dehydrogenase [ubiquinone] 1 alpha subcomplex subunit 7 isoform X1 [Salmo salar]|uniref:NADH dehydrogenase [ubiquinone] 1 alpha subcomplex subunit 7 n=1 Tax=Salmo salar TaxID=8030 RepID=B5X6Q8_SALSA|nr:NADH dehydrogenase [ubiquinone] 1 alpha subcomplex subunit 7 isoform X1 [Salmo salar]ACI66528.1 NADH dehydrogenase 1 alpha subcomplex subunit 7 [Salmo salar]|eukprot:XP_014004765.1 PREDICTED: NADH dehydrogenase [ubiquinone] 1 alpha subcomplex subunit 7-like isoform X1 [Salmo salar]